MLKPIDLNHIKVPTTDERSRLMSRIHGKNTSLEMKVRTGLFKLGYRYRIHYNKIAGRPDIVLPSRKIAIFIHGCYWHAHSCFKNKIPKTNSLFWRAKFERNKIRDKRKVRELKSIGWKTFIIWECKVNKDFEETIDHISKKLRSEQII